jgi:hypothetical protein
VSRVVVHIDRLVLRGYRHEERHAIAAGLQEALRRVLAEPGAAARLGRAGSVSRLTLGRVPIVPGGTGSAVGEGVGRAIGQAATP